MKPPVSFPYLAICGHGGLRLPTDIVRPLTGPHAGSEYVCCQLRETPLVFLGSLDKALSLADGASIVHLAPLMTGMRSLLDTRIHGDVRGLFSPATSQSRYGSRRDRLHQPPSRGCGGKG